MPEVPTRRVTFETTEGTFMNVDVSPGGETLVFDLLGDLYQLPIEGGDALPLTTGMAWDQAPIFSPDGAHVYFVSDRVGYKNLWRLALADGSLRQVTNLNRDIHGSPNWSKAAGQPMVGIEDPEVAAVTNMVLHYIDPASGEVTPINPPKVPIGDLTTRERVQNSVVTYTGIESKDGEVFFSEPSGYLNVSRKYVRLYSFDRATQTRTPLTPEDAPYNEYKPQLSHNGEWLAYYRQYNDRRTELRILDRTTGQDDRLIDLADADDGFYIDEDSRPNYAFTPDDQSIVFWHGGKIQRVAIADGSSQTIPFTVAVEREIVDRVKPPVQRVGATDKHAIIQRPNLSSDQRTLVFAAIGFVWLMDIQTGKVRRLTNSDDLEYMPAISPDGEAVAYISFPQGDDEYGPGRLMVVDIGQQNTRQVLGSSDTDYLLPSWSNDGSKIAVIRRQGTSRNQMQFGWTSATKGSFNSVASAPARGLRFQHHTLFIGFDATDDNMLFSYPESPTQTVLVTADLRGQKAQTIATGTAEVGSIVPAPDLKHLAFTLRDDSVWVVPSLVDSESSTVSSLGADAYRIGNNAGYYADWDDAGNLTFGLGASVYKYRLKHGELLSLDVILPIPALDPVENMAFKGARLVTIAGESGAGPIIENGTVITHGNRIAAIGPTDQVAIPTDALVIDASDKTIVPGFIDTHYHRLGGYSVFGLPGSTTFNDESARAFGITSAWDPGTQVDVAPAGADLQLAGRTAGPRWAFAGAIVNSSTRANPSNKLLDHYWQALVGIRSRGSLGASVLKESNAHLRQWRQWFVGAALESGLGIVAHMEDFDGTMTRIVDGFTGGDHPILPVPFYRDVQELLNRSGFIWTPNVGITAGSQGGTDDIAFFFCNAVSRSENQSYREKLSDYPGVCDLDQRNPSVSYEVHRVSRVAEQVARAASAGATIGVGAHHMPGALLHQEMWYYWKGGMPVGDILRTTTMNNAKKLGLQEEVGSLEVGKIADFLVLDENPLDDILNTLSLTYTVQGGVVYDSATAERIDLSDIAIAQQKKTLH